MFIRSFIKRLAARIPRELPRDQKAVEAFVSDVLATYNLPKTTAYKKAVTKAIHALTQNTHRAPKHFFYLHLARFEAMRAATQVVIALESEEKQAATPKPESQPVASVQNPGV